MNTAVLLPVYNAEKFLRECLESILNQTYPEFVLYACNDGSTDSSWSILQEYAEKDKRVHLLDNGRNMGIVATRNHLLSVLPESAEFAAWIDADDVMFPDRLQRQIDYLRKHPEIGGVGSSLEIIDEASHVTGFRHYPESPEEIRRLLPRRNVLAQSSLMLRKTLIRTIGKYSADYPVCEDYDYWLRALSHYHFSNFKEPVLKYRMSCSQTKQIMLKKTLFNTMRIQKNYMFRYASFRNYLYYLAEFLLLLSPSLIVMFLFKKTQYIKEN